MAHNSPADTNNIITPDRAASLISLASENYDSNLNSNVRVLRTEDNVIIPIILPTTSLPHDDKYLQFTLLIPGGNDNNKNNNNKDNSDTVDKKGNIIKVLDLKDVTDRVTIDTPSSRQPSTFGQCTICYEKTCNCLISPCGHLYCCYDCGKKVYLSRSKCSICNKGVLKVVRIYDSLVEKKEEEVNGKKK